MSKRSHWQFPDARERINWETIAGLPLLEYEKGERDINLLDEWIDVALQFKIEESDRHFAEPRYTTALARLYRLALSKCDFDANEIFALKEEQGSAMDKLREQNALAEERIQRLIDEKAMSGKGMEAMEMTLEELRSERKNLANQVQSLVQDLRSKEREVEKGTVDLEALRKELNRVTRERDDLRRLTESRDADAKSSDADRSKIVDENQYLLKKYKEVSDRLGALSTSYAKLEHEHLQQTATSELQLTSLRSQLAGVQQENADLMAARNRAEDLCERRETQALTDLSELQAAYKDLLTEEQRKYQEMKDEYLQLRDEFELYQRTSVRPQEVEQRDDTIAKLKAELRALRNQSVSEAEFPETPRSSSAAHQPTSELPALNKLLAERQTLEHENDSLRGDVAAFEIKCERQDAQILKLQKRLNEYERGDEGLRRLRQELLDSNRTTEQLQDETQQLRERLAQMEDVAALCNSLKILCRRVGVTQEEIDRLQGSTNSRFGELDILRQETSSLKEEIEWLEKERRYWMNKVRLQPLLDTRLRFELGLTSEQLKQLDNIVDQMKGGSVVVGDTESVYREKYLKEVRERQADAQQFNERMRERIEEVLASVVSSAVGGGSALVNPAAAPTLALVIEDMRRHVAEAAASAAGSIVSAGAGGPGANIPEVPHPLLATYSSKQMESMSHKLDEMERLNNDLAEQAVKLRERLAAADAALAAVQEERDAYRNVVFDAATATPQQAGGVDPDQHSRPATTGARAGTTTREAAGSPRLRTYEVSSLVKDQLKTKELRIQQLSVEYDTLQAARNNDAAKMSQLSEQCQIQSARVAALEAQVASLSSTLKMSSERIAELEKVNDELSQGLKSSEVAPSTRELLQKIVLLRQREAKLMQRFRIASDERDDALRQQEKLQSYIDTSLDELKEVMSGTARGSVLPPSTSEHASEMDAIRTLQHQLSVLAEGQLFVEDKRFLASLCEAVDRFDNATESAVLRVQLRQQKEQSDADLLASQEKIIELERTMATRASEPLRSSAPSNLELEAEATAWRQKCALYSKRLSDRDGDLKQVEEQLAASRDELVACRRELQELMRLQTERNGPRGGGDDESSSSATAAARHSDTREYVKLEREVARLKSLNLGLIQGAIDAQAERKKLTIQLSTVTRHLQLVQDSHTGGSKAVSEFVVTALKDNSMLQQQCELAQYQLKKMRLQLFATESNFRVVANEAGAYKLSAHRLFKKYAEHVVKIVDACRQLRRSSEGCMTARRAFFLLHRVEQSLALANEEHRRAASVHLRVADLEVSSSVLRDELELLEGKGGRLADVERGKLAEGRALVRNLSRQLAQVTEDRDFLAARLSRTEDSLASVEKEITLLEVGERSVAIGGDESLLHQLKELKDTVFAKTEAPPIAVTTTSSASLAIDGDTTMRDFKDALDKQADLSKRCALLQQELTEQRRLQQIENAKAVAAREELVHVQQQLAAASGHLEAERQRFAEREARLAQAHQSQLDVAQKSVEYNTQCFKDLIAGKERTIAQLQQQLQTERQRYLEHQLLDTTKMERLHEQLFRENNAMMERFKQSMDEAATHGSAAAAASAALAPHGAPGDAVQQQLQSLTQETLQLRGQVKDLRTRNILLESQLNDQIAVSQQQVKDALSRGGGSAVLGGVVEQSLLSVSRDQSVALENLRRREQELVGQLQSSQEEVKRLHAEVFDLRNQLIDSVDTLSRTQQTSLALGGGGNLSGGLLGSAMQNAPQSLVNEMRTQIAELTSQLNEARAQLSYERAHVKHATSQSDEFKKHMQQLERDLVGGHVHVDHARQLVATNQVLRADIDAVKEQNEKLQTVTAFLKQKLVEQTQCSSDRETRLQQELALAQRMTVLQQQAADQIGGLQLRVSSLQDELNARVLREEDILRKSTSAQRFAEEQHHALLLREREIVELKRELQTLRQTSGKRGGSPPSGPSKGRPSGATGVEKGSQVIVTELTTAGTATASIAQAPASTPLPLAQPPMPAPPAQTASSAQPSSGATPAASASALVLPPASERPAAESGRSQTATDELQTLKVPTVTCTIAVQTDPVVVTQRRQRDPAAQQPAKSDVMDHPKTSESSSVAAPHVAGLVSRQVMAMQKEKQQQIDSLASQLRQLQADAELSASRAATEKASLAAKVDHYRASVNELKAKLDQSELDHRTEILKFLEERNQQKAGVLHAQRQTTKRRSRSTFKEQHAQTDAVSLSTEASPTSAKPPTAVAASSTPPPSSGAQARPLWHGVCAPPDPTSPTPPAPSSVLSVPKVGVDAGCQADQDGTQASAPTQAASPRGQQTKKWVELLNATNDLKVQEVLRRLRKDNEALLKKNQDLLGQVQELDKVRADLSAKTAEIELMRKSSVTQSQQPTSPLEIRSHKREILKLEEYVDQLRRDINVKKEVELRELLLANERLTRDVQRLEAENARLSGSASVGGTAADANTAVAMDATVAAAEAKVRQFENQLLAQEGLLLDLRFERETLQMKITRLEKHLSDVLNADSTALRSAGPNVGKTAKRREPTLPDVTSLENLVENLKLVVERLQSENLSLKANSVSSAQYVDIVREVKALRHREREMLARIAEQHGRIEELQAALLPGSKMSEHVATLQRRLRMAQSAAEQYQLELYDLKSRLAASGQPAVLSTTGHVLPQQGAGFARPLSPEAFRQHAPETHHLLSHHH